MSEKKTSLKVPEKYLGILEDIRLLKNDESNPNRMTVKQHEELWKSLTKYGWTYPLITDLEGLVADGEQRIMVCKQHQEFFAPVIRLPLSDVQRRTLRQTLNKLKGKHNKEEDEKEWKLIIEGGERDSLQSLLASVGERLPDDAGEIKLRPSIAVPDSWELIVECKDEAEQKVLFDRFTGEGIKCRVLNL